MSKWISVKDELPPIEVDVLIWPYIHSSDTNKIASYNGLEFEVYYDSGFGVDRAGSKSITHWMPLPEPPK